MNDPEPELPNSISFDASGSASAFVSLYRRFAFGTCYAYIDVEDSDGYSALLKAKQEVLALVAALSLNHETPYRLVPAFAINGNVADSPEITKYVSWPHRELTGSDAGVVRADYNAIVGDDSARLAARTLGHAYSLHDMEPGLEIFSAALLSYYKVIEILSNKVKVKLPSDVDGQRQAVIRSLANDLNRSTSIHKQMTAIHSSSDRLKRIEVKFTTLRIDAAAIEYGLGETWSRRAAALAKFRNTRLGHGGSGPSLENLEDWLSFKEGGAPELARSMLRAYLIYKRDDSNSA